MVRVFNRFGGGKKGGRKGGESKVIFCVYLLFICAAIQLNRCCVCELVEVLSRNLVGGRTAIVLAVSVFFREELREISLGIM